MLNQTLFIGRLTDNPAVFHKKTGERESSVARYRLAVDRDYVDQRTGERGTDFIPCKAFGASAKYAEQYFRKGDMAAVSGRLVQEEYEKDGKRSTFLVVYVERSYYLKKKNASQTPGSVSEGSSVDDDYEYPPIPEGI